MIMNHKKNKDKKKHVKTDRHDKHTKISNTKDMTHPNHLM